jgi:hypothetical protein
VKIVRIPYGQLVSILSDHKDSEAEAKVESPFMHANDHVLAKAAAEYVRNYIYRLQRNRPNPSPDPFTKMLEVVGYPIKRMRQAALDDLETDLDDFVLRLSNFADYMLSPIESSIPWCVLGVDIDGDHENVVVKIGRDHRISQYYILQKQLAEAVNLPVVKLPDSASDTAPGISGIRELADLEELEQGFNAYIDAIFKQIDNAELRFEVRQKLIESINSKS